MVTRNTWFSRILKNRSYTLVEMMVVLGIIAVISSVGFYGVGQFNKDQLVVNAQKQFIETARALQNQVNNGTGGEKVKRLWLAYGASSIYYTVNQAGNPTTITLPTGVTIQHNIPTKGADACCGGLQICFANPNLTSYTATVPCWNASGSMACNDGGAYFACKRHGTAVYEAIGSSDMTRPSNPVGTSSYNGPQTIQITFSNGTTSRKVNIEGYGMDINRIYGL